MTPPNIEKIRFFFLPGGLHGFSNDFFQFGHWDLTGAFLNLVNEGEELFPRHSVETWRISVALTFSSEIMILRLVRNVKTEHRLCRSFHKQRHKVEFFHIHQPLVGQFQRRDDL